VQADPANDKTERRTVTFSSQEEVAKALASGSITTDEHRLVNEYVRFNEYFAASGRSDLMFAMEASRILGGLIGPVLFAILGKAYAGVIGDNVQGRNLVLRSLHLMQIRHNEARLRMLVVWLREATAHVFHGRPEEPDPLDPDGARLAHIVAVFFAQMGAPFGEFYGRLIPLGLYALGVYSPKPLHVTFSYVDNQLRDASISTQD
jgi:hypothetical protein